MTWGFTSSDESRAFAERGIFVAFNPLSAALNWLRAGYPDGVPREDYVALLAVLRHKLTEVEVHDAAAALTAERDSDEPIDAEEIEAAIAELLLQVPNDDDIERVKERLAAGGWTLADTGNGSTSDTAKDSLAERVEE
jgi:hypothetical protein